MTYAHDSTSSSDQRASTLGSPDDQDTVITNLPAELLGAVARRWEEGEGQRFARVFFSLSEEDRRVLQLLYYEGLVVAVAARMLHLSIDELVIRCRRAVDVLNARLEVDGWPFSLTTTGFILLMEGRVSRGFVDDEVPALQLASERFPEPRLMTSPDGVRDAVLEGLNDEDPGICEVAIQALTVLDPEVLAAIPEITEILLTHLASCDEAVAVRVAAVEALSVVPVSQSDYEAVTSGLCARLEDEADAVDVRIAVAEALVVLGSIRSPQPNALRALLALLKNRGDALPVRMSAVRALASLAVWPDVCPVAFPNLLGHLRDAQEFQDIRAVSATAVGLIGQRVPSRARDAVSGLLSALVDVDPRVQVAVIEALASMGPVLASERAEVLSALETACRNEHSSVRDAATQAIAVVPPAPAVEVIREEPPGPQKRPWLRMAATFFLLVGLAYGVLRLVGDTVARLKPTYELAQLGSLRQRLQTIASNYRSASKAASPVPTTDEIMDFLVKGIDALESAQRRTLGLFPHYDDHQVELAIANLSEAHRRLEALRTARPPEEMTPESEAQQTLAAYLLAKACLMQGNVVEAEHWLDEVLATPPDVLDYKREATQLREMLRATERN